MIRFILNMLFFGLITQCSTQNPSNHLNGEERKPQTPVSKSELFPNGVNKSFSIIAAGNYKIGSIKFLDSVEIDESPRTVKLNKYAIMTHEVTQKQFELLMGINPANNGNKPNHPIENITYFQALEFAAKLSKLFDCNDCFSLPTEAQWEVAAQGKKSPSTTYFFGDDTSKLSKYAYYHDDQTIEEGILNETKSIGGERLSNDYGVFDIYGNVWEWCKYDFDQPFYKEWSTKNSDLPKSEKDIGVDTDVPLRGGSCMSNKDNCRTSVRMSFPADWEGMYYGFRLVLNESNLLESLSK